MMQHRFEIGQLVTAYLMGVPSGPIESVDYCLR